MMGDRSHDGLDVFLISGIHLKERAFNHQKVLSGENAIAQMSFQIEKIFRWLKIHPENDPIFSLAKPEI
jgi:hypothetical protein